MDLSYFFKKLHFFLILNCFKKKIDSDHLFRDRIGRYFHFKAKKRKRESLDSLFLDDTIPI